MNNIYKKIILRVLGIICFCGQQIYSQQDEQISMYNYNPLYFNPAYAGSRGSLNIATTARFQWVGFNGAPMTQFFSANMPIVRQNIGLGMHVVNDRIGARNRTSIYFSFAFGIRLNKKGHRLAFGLNGGIDLNAYDFTSLPTVDPNDPLKANSFFLTTGNVGAGIYYYGERHYIGVAMPRILENNLLSDTIYTAMQRRHVFFMAGGVMNLSSIVQFKPTTIVKYTPNAPLTFDINASFGFNNKIWVGAMYRFHESVGVNVVWNPTKWMQVGYAYDFPINGLRLNSWGTHEIMLNFDITKRNNNYISPRYF